MPSVRPETLRARRNTPFVHVFTVTDADGEPMDLTGHTAGMQVRLYGMQPGEPLLNLETVTTEQTDGLLISGSTVTPYVNRIDMAFMPSGNVDGRDDSFVYDLILTDPTGYSWIERWGPFEVTEGVTADAEIFLTAIDGRLLTTTVGAYLETA